MFCNSVWSRWCRARGRASILVTVFVQRRRSRRHASRSPASSLVARPCRHAGHDMRSVGFSTVSRNVAKVRQLGSEAHMHIDIKAVRQ